MKQYRTPGAPTPGVSGIRLYQKKGRGVKMVKSVSPQRRRGRRGITFLFGGEAFDTLRILSGAKGKPPNKKASSMPDHAVLAAPGDEAQLRI